MSYRQRLGENRRSARRRKVNKGRRARNVRTHEGGGGNPHVWELNSQGSRRRRREAILDLARPALFSAVREGRLIVAMGNGHRHRDGADTQRNADGSWEDYAASLHRTGSNIALSLWIVNRLSREAACRRLSRTSDR